MADLIFLLVMRAKDGDKSAARDLATIAAERLRDGRPMPEPVRDWLASALESAASGEDAGRALLLAGRRGRRQHDFRSKWIDVAMTVEHLEGDMDLNDAIQAAADHHHVDAGTAAKYHKRYLKHKD
ncbi:MAG: hypothetical protein U5S82_23115 [Gammaproteobacteria bacterium]|nr:hypothetical protein [Gammaproteobacteria bacterium]